MGVHVICKIVATVAHDLLSGIFVHSCKFGQCGERMPAAVGCVDESHFLLHNIVGAAQIGMIASRSKQLGISGTLHHLCNEWHNALMDRDDTVLSCCCLDAADHIAFFQVHIILLNRGELSWAHSGVYHH